jgi:acetate kinase
VDTSMGLTPLEGLTMGTRSGDVDPGLHDYLARQAGLSLEQITAALNRDSGLSGLSGLGGDLRTLEAAAGDGHAGAALAIGVFVDRLVKGIARMAAAMDGLDALVLTGGIGEHSAQVRAATLRRLGWLGLQLDEAANAAAVGGVQGRISRGPVPALVVATDEERSIARQSAALLGGAGAASPAAGGHA